jgi:osmotically-inducible protein OsmY
MRKNWVVVVVALALLVTAAGCRSLSTATPDEIDPAAIEASVRSQVAGAYPDETFDIGVSVSDEGVVTLTGDVDSAEQKSRIGELAGSVAGVTRVLNNLTVE